MPLAEGRHALRRCLLVRCLAVGSHRGLLPQEQQSTQPGAPRRLSTPRNQIALDGGSLLAFSASYVRRVGDTELSAGGGIGFAWELNFHDFDANIWEALHIELFLRYWLQRVLQIDLGATALRYYWTDDCSACTGAFWGFHSAAMVGYRVIFVGANGRLGWASDDRHGSEFGAIVSPELRIVLPWG